MVEIKTDLKSCEMKEGYMRSPQRSLLYALGLTPEEINRPLVGIVNSFNEVVPGHMHLRHGGGGGESRGAAGRRHSVGVSGDCRLRRHCYGACGYEIFSG